MAAMTVDRRAVPHPCPSEQRGRVTLKFLQLDCGCIVAPESRCPSELVDEGIERAVLVVRRAEIAKAEMRLGVEALR